MQTQPLRNLLITLAVAIALLIGALGALQTQAQEPTGKQPLADPTFTYQGRLTQGSAPYSGTCSFDFKLYNALSGGAQIGATNSKTGVAVKDGYFNAELFFGNTAFQGDDRYLDITVDCGGGATALTPRAKLTRAPQAQYASEAGSVEWSAVNNHPAFVESAGTGLSLSGATMSITPAYRLPQSCANNQIAKWNGSVWTCAADDDAAYAAGTGLNLNGVTMSLASAYRLPQSCADNQIAYWDSSNSIWQCVNPGAVSWALTGNSGTTAAANFIGTTDNVSFTIKTGNKVVMRFTPGPSGYLPNIIAGSEKNVISGATGSVIGGGGGDVWANEFNRIEGRDANYDVIAGGSNNVISGNLTYFRGSAHAVIGGGQKNVINGKFWGNGSHSIIGGGYNNLNQGLSAVIGGGNENSIINGGDDCGYCGEYTVINGGSNNRIWSYENGLADYSSIGGGHSNVISTGHHAVIGGGYYNIIRGNEDWAIPPVGGSNTIGGGYGNLISATNYAVIPGGRNNTVTADNGFAAGYRARAIHDNSFVWSDGSSVFSSTVANQFAVQATGGVKLAIGAAKINVNDHYTLPYTGGVNNALLQLDSSGDANWVKPAILQFNPQSSAPVTCGGSTEGAMSYGSSSHRLCYCNGTNWLDVYTDGACSW